MRPKLVVTRRAGMRLPRHRWLLTLLVLCGPAPALANDSAISGVGGTVAPMKEHPSVRMESERVRAVLRPTVQDVEATFVLRNQGPATTVRIGFPERGWGDVGKETAEFLSFTSTVDGRPVRVTATPWEGEGGMRLTRWRVKTVRFGRGQRRVVTVRYRSRPGATVMGIGHFNYVLKTGASWKGTIGSALITADTSRLSGYRITEVTPQPSARSRNRITWRFRNLEPTQDLHIMYAGPQPPARPAP